MNTIKQNILLVGILGVLVYGTFVTPHAADAPQFLGGVSQAFVNAYNNGVTHTTSSVGVSPVQVLSQNQALLNETIENLGTTVVFCYQKATTTGVVANAGMALQQYGVFGADANSPYYGGIACVTSSGTSTVSVVYK